MNGQVQIFFSLLSSVALSFSDDENAGSNIDVLLVFLLFLPVTLAVVLDSPLKTAVSALMSRLAAKRTEAQPESSWRDRDVPESPPIVPESPRVGTTDRRGSLSKIGQTASSDL